MAKILYSKDGEACSFPCHFEIFEENGARYCSCTSSIYCNLQIPDDRREEAEAALNAVTPIAAGRYQLSQGEIIYRTILPYDENGDNIDQEVAARRHFIEDFIENEAEIRAIAETYKGESRKTEFC